MLTTSNYNLNKPEGSDVVDITLLSSNFDTIDTTMKTLSDKSIGYSVTGGTANTYTATISGITSYTDGLTVRVKINLASTGASTLNVNGLGAKTILDSLGNAITSGGLKAGLPYQLCYNGTNFIVLGKGGGGDAIASQIILGKKATVDSGQIVGTLDLSNLVTGNIKSGVTINGVSGSTTVVDTADAVLDPAYLLTGYSGYDDGVKKNGQLANLGSSQQAVDTWTDGNGTLVYRLPSTGAFTGTVNGYKPELSKYDANFIASNIAIGKTVFGLTGSATPASLGGKNFASGTITSNPSTITVSGLIFTPSSFLILLNGGSLAFYGSTSKSATLSYQLGTTATKATTFTANGFTSNVGYSGYSGTWYAWE